jgi:hypothetical protein
MPQVIPQASLRVGHVLPKFSGKIVVPGFTPHPNPPPQGADWWRFFAGDAF